MSRAESEKQGDTGASTNSQTAAAVFVISIIVASLLWPFINLPFRNPLGVVGTLTDLQFNPLSNQVRALTFIVLPAFTALFLRAFPVKLPALPAPFPTVRDPLCASLLIFTAIAVALNVKTLHAWGPFDGFHEGESLGSAVSFMNGEVPYSDFLFLHGLIQDPLRAVLAFNLFGESIGSVRALESSFKILNYILLAVLLLRLFRPTHLAVAIFLFLISLNGFNGILAPASLAARDLPCLLFLLLANEFREEESPGRNRFRFFLMGTLVMFGMIYSVDRGVYLFASAIATTFIYCLLSRRWSVAVIYLGAGLATGTAFLLALLEFKVEALIDFTRFTFVILPAYKDLLDGYVFDLFVPENFSIMLLAAACFFLWSTRLVHALSARPEGWNGDLVFSTALCSLAISLLRNLLNRPDRIHLEYSSMLLYICFLHLSAPLWWRHINKDTWRTGALGVLLLVSAVSNGRVFTTGLFEENFPITRKDREIISAAYFPLLDFLEDANARGEKFFAFTSDPSLYYLTRQPSPTRFSLAWAASTNDFQRQMTEELEVAGVAWIVTNAEETRSEPDGIQISRRLPLVASYVDRHYAPFLAFGHFRVLKRLQN